MEINQYDAKVYNRDLCLSIDFDKANWLIFGDSYASGAYVMFSRTYPEINFLQLTIPGCYVNTYQRKLNSIMCSELQTEAYEFIQKSSDLDGVIISSNWHDPHLTQLPIIIEFIKTANKEAIVINQRIRFKEKVPSILSSSLTEALVTRKANLLLEKRNAIIAKKSLI